MGPAPKHGGHDDEQRRMEKGANRRSDNQERPAPCRPQAVLESEHSHEPGICRGQETKDCNTCPLWKSLGNRKYKGTTIPGGYGKCIRPGGHCSPFLVREGIGATKKEER